MSDDRLRLASVSPYSWRSFINSSYRHAVLSRRVDIPIASTSTTTTSASMSIPTYLSSDFDFSRFPRRISSGLNATERRALRDVPRRCSILVRVFKTKANEAKTRRRVERMDFRYASGRKLGVVVRPNRKPSKTTSSVRGTVLTETTFTRSRAKRTISQMRPTAGRTERGGSDQEGRSDDNKHEVQESVEQG